jgi:hypothetical protein
MRPEGGTRFALTIDQADALIQWLKLHDVRAIKFGLSEGWPKSQDVYLILDSGSAWWIKPDGSVVSA